MRPWVGRESSNIMLCPIKSFELQIMNYYLSTTFGFFLSIFLIPACSSTDRELPDEVKKLDNLTIHEINSTPTSSITLTKAVTFENSSEVIFGQLNEIDVDNSGTVYIVEGSDGNEGIYVFDAEGVFINKIGRTGRGPGEFQALFDIDVFGDQIFTLDGTLLRIQVFSSETYNSIHEANLDPGQWDYSGERTMTFPNKFHVLNDSTILGIFNHYTFDMDTWSYYHLDMNGNVTSERLLTHDYIKHLKTGDGSQSFFDPFGGRGLMAKSSDNLLFTAWSKDILFKVYDSDGTYLRAFYHPFDNSNLSWDEALNFYDIEPFKNALRNEGIPDKWRAFDHLIIDDDNKLWISTITDDRKIYEWWIMDTYGNLQAKFKWPRGKEIQKIKNGFAYVLEAEEDTGLQEVIKYRIQWSD